MAAILAALVNKHLPSKKRNFAEKMVVQLETPRLHPLFPPDPPLPKFKCESKIPRRVLHPAEQPSSIGVDQSSFQSVASFPPPKT